MPSVLTIHPRRLATAPRLRVLDARPDEARLAIEGLLCAACAARTSRALRRVDGVEEARVDLDNGTAELRLRPGATLDIEALRAALGTAVIAGGARRWIETAVRWATGGTMSRTSRTTGTEG